MRLNLLYKAALPLALVCMPMLGQETVEIHGYTRAGVGASSNGGEQVSFFMADTGGAPTNGPGYRLGNETDNYLELAVDVRAYEQAGSAFKLHFRPAFRQYYSMRDASADAGGTIDNSTTTTPNQLIYIRETYGDATGVFGKSGAFKDATVWIGRRFYERQDLHLRDEWYWNDSGDGFGIEHIDLGGAKMAYAYIQHDVGNLTSNWNNGSIQANVNPYSQWVGDGNGGGGHTTVGSHDLRFSDIKMPWDGGSMIVGAQYNVTRNATGVQTVNGTPIAKFNNTGTEVFVELNQANVMGGDNRIFATWGNGNTFWNWYNPEVSTKNTWYQVMDVAYLKLAKNLEMQGTLIYRKQSADESNGSNMKGNSNTWISAGVRPVYFFTKHVSVAAEVGYDKMKFINEDTDRHLLKETLALQLSPQASFWSRPSLRFFVTHASWDKAANNWNLIGAGQFGQAMSGTTFGAQVEAWW